MSPKAIVATVLLLSCLLVTSGCRRNRAKTSADLPPPAAGETAMATPGPETAAPEPEMPAPEPDPLAGDLEDVNQYLRRQGLLGDTYFDYDRASLTPQAREQLARSAGFLQEHPRFLVTLEGHCDERGTTEYNLALGERRVQSTRDYLASLGVDGSRLSTISYGEERPVCSEPEESCWWQNRRAHPTVTGRSER